MFVEGDLEKEKPSSPAADFTNLVLCRPNTGGLCFYGGLCFFA